MAKKQPTPERELFTTIRKGQRKEVLANWRFYEILGALRWMGLDYLTAYDAAKWARRARSGETIRFENGITMEVHA